MNLLVEYGLSGLKAGSRGPALVVALVAGLGGGAAMAEGLKLNLGVASVKVGGNSVAAVKADVAGVGVRAEVLNGNSVAHACVGTCGGSGTGGGGTGGGLLGGGLLGGGGGLLGGGVNVSVGGTGAGGGGIGVVIGGGTGTGGGTGGGGGGGGTTPPVVPVPVALDSRPAAVPPTGRMRCAGDGNTVVYNGYSVVDRNGVFVGWVNDTRLDANLKIMRIRLETLDKRCVGLSGGSFRVTGSQMAVNVDAAALQ
jgi:hypothetical protein